MDRDLQIAMVSGALAILCGYALGERLRRSGQFQVINRRHKPGIFWAVMIVLGTIESAFIGMALMYLAAWLDKP